MGGYYSGSIIEGATYEDKFGGRYILEKHSPNGMVEIKVIFGVQCGILRLVSDDVFRKIICRQVDTDAEFGNAVLGMVT